MWIFAIIKVLHVIISIILIGAILLQAGKGGGMGVAFGGMGSNTMFSSHTTANFLTRITAIIAAIFMLSSLSLAWASSRTDSSRLKKASKERPKVSEVIAEMEAEEQNKDESTKKTQDSIAQNKNSAQQKQQNNNQQKNNVKPKQQPNLNPPKKQQNPVTTDNQKENTNPVPSAMDVKPNKNTNISNIQQMGAVKPNNLSKPQKVNQMPAMAPATMAPAAMVSPKNTTPNK